VRGPWAVALVEALGEDELPVEGLSVREGVVEAEVEGCAVVLEAEPVPQRIWSSMWRFTRGNGALEAAAEGRLQSEHLDLLLREDWDAPLIPAEVRTSCACHADAGCAHVRSLVRAFAERVDADPSALLRWRGCTPERARVERELHDEPVAIPAEAWEAGELPVLRPPRPLPPGAVLKRLGPSGIRVGERDLADVLQRAYEAFSTPNDADQASPGSSVSSPSPD
jgi:hypothetical protein